VLWFTFWLSAYIFSGIIPNAALHWQVLDWSPDFRLWMPAEAGNEKRNRTLQTTKQTEKSIHFAFK
jgi:hypothetical protein